MSMFIVGFVSSATLVATLACLSTIALIVKDINELHDDVMSGMDEFKLSSLFSCINFNQF
uniref:Col_cuticle_N domain-containing protein n=1 Tax=Heterorhabditis bacteriophora TaxID=37862 RepID=A0A1I7WK38_HETBA